MANLQHDDNNVKGFFSQYRWLSNFEPCHIEFRGVMFHSSEAAYQSAKSGDPEDQKKFISITANDSRNLGQTVKTVEGWDEIKFHVMEEVLNSKFYKNSYLRDRLIATGSKYLEETNYWDDKFWGVCDGVGANYLGRLLMKVRRQLTDGVESVKSLCVECGYRYMTPDQRAEEHALFAKIQQCDVCRRERGTLPVSYLMRLPVVPIVQPQLKMELADNSEKDE